MKNNSTIWIIVIAALVIGGAYLSLNSGESITVDGEQVTPGDDGFLLRLFDANGNELIIPEGFSSTSNKGLFSVWTTTSPITCSTDTNCPTGTTCWQGECVMQNVASMSLGFVVESDSNSVTYTNLGVKSATPTAWATALGTAHRTLAPGATQVFTSSIFAIPTAWEGTTQSFSVTIDGTNNYDGQVEEDTKTVSYQFFEDPTGGFTVSISNPFS